MKFIFKPTIHHAVYLVALIGGFTVTYLLLSGSSDLAIILLGLVSFVGWFHFLRLVVISKEISFDAKMVWFISIFSFFFIAAPLFLIFVVNRKSISNHE